MCLYYSVLVSLVNINKIDNIFIIIIINFRFVDNEYLKISQKLLNQGHVSLIFVHSIE